MSPSAPRERIDGQISGYWIDRDRPAPPQLPRYQFTGAVLPRVGETKLDDFVCLDLVLVDAGPTFVWLPLSEAGRYTYSHSLGLLYGEPWRLVVYANDGRIDEYDAAYDEYLPPGSNLVAQHYGREAEIRARQDYPTVQLRLRLRHK